MSLMVFTARIGRWMKGEPDAIDITRKSAKPEWLCFAPSWAILGPAIEAKRRAVKIEQDAYALTNARLGRTATPEEDGARYLMFADAESISETAWREYVPAFMDEMRASWKEHRPMWDNLLSRQRVILCCYCMDAERCHRTILRRDILPKLGAEDCGEMKT